jgi:hypothetical protein
MTAGPWVAPDAPSEPQPVRAPLVPGATAGVLRGAGRAPGVPVPLRPMSVADLLDGSLRILKLAPRTVLALTAVFVVPAQLVLAVLSRRWLREDTSATVSDVLFGGFLDAFVVQWLLEGLALALVCVGVSELASAWYTGHDRTLAELLLLVRRRAVVLVAAWVLVHIAEAAAAVALVVPLLLVAPLFAVVAPVVACERRNPWRSIGRSTTLVRRRYGAVLGLVLLVALVDALLAAGLGAVGGTYAALELPASWLVATVISSATNLVTVPFVAGAATLLYLDLRVRTEGLDIQLATAKRFPDA